MHLSLCDVHLALVYVHLAFCDELSSLCNHNLSLLHAYMIRIYHYCMCFFNHVMWFRLCIMSCWTSICNMVSLYSICFFFWRFANSFFRLTQNVMWKNEGITCFVITYWWHQQKCIGNSTSKKKSLMNLNVNAILKLILFERILMYTLCDLSNRDLVQYWLQNCSYFINVTALLKTIVFDAYLLKTFLINAIFVNNTYRT